MPIIVTKNSSTATDVPTSSQLVQGELAVNVTDRRLFTENASAAVVEIGTNPSSITTGAITATGTFNGVAVNASGAIAGASLSTSGSVTGATLTDGTASLSSGSWTSLVGVNASGTIQFGNLSDGSISIASFLNSDTMSGASAVNVPTAISVKNYVDSVSTNQDLDFQGDAGGQQSVDLNSQILDIAGGINISTTASGQELTVNLDAALSGLTSAAFSGGVTAGSFAGPLTGNVTGNISGSGSSSLTTFATTNLTAGGVVFPASDGTSGQVISSNGSGVASWATIPGLDANLAAFAAQFTLPTANGNNGQILSQTSSGNIGFTNLPPSTLGTLTQTFTNGQATTISLTDSVLAPVVSVTKEVAQTAVTNNNWNVNSTTENYTRLDSAPATTLDWGVGDVSTAVYTQVFSVAAQETNPQGLAFNTDGTKMFVTGNGGDDVNEYALSTGFDVSTAVFTDAFSVAAQDLNPYGLAFNTTGTKMFISGSTGDAVYEYALSTGFDVSTASYTDSFSVAAQDIKPQDIAFNTDGTKMFIVGDTSNSVYEYALSTGFDVSTASYTDAFSVAGQDLTPEGIAFNADGTSMFVAGRDNDSVYEYTLATGFDVSTASFNTSFSVASQEVSPTALAFNTTGTKMFVCGYTGDDVNEYTISTPLTLGTGSFTSADVGKTIEANSGVFVLTATSGSYVETTTPTSYAQVASGSWEMYGAVYNTTDGDLELSGVNTGFDVSEASFVDSFSISGQETEPQDLAFNTDGTKMFVVGFSGDDVNEYTLSTEFDVSSATFVDSFSVGSQETIPRGLAFNTDGTKMFVCGQSGQDVNEYALSTGFDVSTASFIDAFSVSSQDTVPTALAFNTDGTKMFVLGSTGDDVNEYALTTGFDVSTSSFTDSFSVSAQETDPHGLAFNTDGTKMFVVGPSGDDVNEYQLSTGFDVSTSTFTDSFSIAAQEITPTGLTFSTDGTKMFVLGESGDDVNEYNVGVIATATGYNPVHTTASIDSTYWTDINSMTANQAAGSGTINYCISTDDRTTWGIVDNTSGERDIVRNNGGTWQYNSNGTYASETWANGTTNTELATIAEAMEGATYTVQTYDVTTSVFVDDFSIASQQTSIMGFCFSPSGDKMYVVGTSSDSVSSYTLSTAFDVSTSSFVNSFSVAAQDTAPHDVVLSTDGTKMFVLGSTGKDVNEYSLTTAFDVSTASFTDSFSISGQEATPYALAFNPDGTKMFVLGYSGDDVNEYSLSTGFDVSTASYSQNFYVGTQSTIVTGLGFSIDGTHMYVVGNDNREVYEYTLTTGFDVSTASYVNLFGINIGGTAKVRVNNDGTKMYILNYSDNLIREYAMGVTSYTNKMDKTQLDAVTDPNHIVLGNDLDLAIVFNLASGTTVPSSDGVAINYDATVLNKGAILGTDYDFDAPAQNKVRITALAGNNLKVRVI